LYKAVIRIIKVIISSLPVSCSLKTMPCLAHKSYTTETISPTYLGFKPACNFPN